MVKRNRKKCHPLELFSRHVKELENGCWIWIGGTTPRGYGCQKIEGKMVRAHRLSYQIFKGPIPEKMYVCHTCDVPLCVNPDHLFIGTPLDNVNDMRNKRRDNYIGRPKNNGKYCKWGHEYTPETIFYNSNNVRGCRICMRISVNKCYRKRKAEGYRRWKSLKSPTAK